VLTPSLTAAIIIPSYSQIWCTEYQTNGDRLELNSSNRTASLPPATRIENVTSTDNKDDKRKKAGGQQGHAGTTLVIIMK
jgi:hypothetical protein